jgi:hypothetical protein
MIEQYTSPAVVNNSQEPWLVGEGVSLSGSIAIPSLDFNFVTDAFPGTVTFTRASSATFFDSAGVLQSAAIDVPRFDYNPATLAARGLLIEESRTNSIRNNTVVGAVAGTPGTLPTNWNVSTALTGLTREVVGTGTESGITYIDIRLSGTPSAAGTYLFLTETTTAAAAASGQTWTNSGYFKLQAGSTTGISAFRLYFQENNSGGGYLTEQNITVTTPTSAALSTQRVSGSRTLNQATTAFVMPGFNFTLTGVAIDITLRIGLPQLEAGAFATSVIPTTTTALTRAADVASVNTLSPWYNAAESTLYLEAVPVGVRSVASPIVTIDDGTTSNRIAMTATAANAMQNSTVVSGALSGNSTSPATTYAAGSTYKIAFAVQLDNVQSASGGASGIVDTTALIPSGLTALKFTGQGASSGLNNFWFRRFTYYPRRLSNAELQAITA